MRFKHAFPKSNIIIGNSNCIIIFLVAFFTMANLSICAQTRTLSGKIICFNTIPIESVSIKSVKAKDETISDSLGNFKIKVRSKSDRIKLKAKGFTTIAFKINKDQDSVRLNMVYEVSDKNNKMVTAYGHISKDDLTYALSNLKFENNRFSNYRDIFEILSTFPGIRIDRSLNPPGVNIRNATSFLSDTQPLFIIDGLQADRDFIADLDPVEIKEISILKGAGASIYGSRGANGVVIIELK